MLTSLAEKHQLGKVRPVFRGLHTRAARATGGERLLSFYLVKVNGSVAEACAALQSDPTIEYATPNHLYSCDVTPNDPEYPNQWGLSRIQAATAWDTQRGGAAGLVAIVDTGVDWNHPDLQGNIWTNGDEIAVDGLDNDGNGYIDDRIGWDFVTADPAGVYPGEDAGPPDPDPMDFFGHGTCVGGIVSAVTNNATGVAGVTWHCPIMILRAGYKRLDGRGELRESDIAEAITYAADNGARVINMSFGGSESDPLTANALAYAQAAGCVLVASAGNDGSPTPNYPAAEQSLDVIAVAATTNTGSPDLKASFSTFGNWVDVSAPGENIRTTAFNDTYGTFAGTSAAAPFVSGLAGLLVAQNSSATSTEIRWRIVGTADEIDSVNPIHTGMLGSGRINAYRALTETPHPSLAIDGFSVVTEENGNGWPDPGEHVELGVRIKNRWTEATAVQAVLSTVDPRVAIAQGSATFGAIAPDGVVQGTPFSLTLAPTIARGESLAFDLLISASDGYQVTRRLNVKMSYAWPVNLTGGTFSAGIMADLDEDGRDEFIIGSRDGSVHALRQDGTSLPGWPVFLNWEVNDSPAAGDVDGDGHLEVVASTDLTDGPGNLYVINRQGRILDGSPIRADSCNSPVLADLDADGRLEIIFATYCYPNSFDVVLHVVRYDGTELPGWPSAAAYYPITRCGPPAVGDVDGDGHLEIVATSGVAVYIWNTTGQVVFGSGWWITSKYGLGPASLVDLDGDSDLEILTASEEFKKSFAIHHTGQSLPGWPIIGSAPTPADVDGDGWPEFVGAKSYTDVCIWRTDATVLPGWPQTKEYEPGEAALLDVDGDMSLEVFYGRYGWRAGGQTLVGWPRTLPSRAGIVGTAAALPTLGCMGFLMATEYPDRKVYLFEAGPIPLNSNRSGWSMYRHDACHTGRLELPPALHGDLDRDRDVDERDVIAFVLCSNGPSVGHPIAPKCQAADLDKDGDVDLDDFGRVQRCYGGPGVPISAACSD